MKWCLVLNAMALGGALLSMNCNAPDAQLDPEPELSTQASALEGSGSLVIYDDALHPDWNDWSSWEATQDPDATSPAPHDGSYSMAVTFQGPYRVLELRPAAPFAAAPYGQVGFWVHGGSTGGQQVSLQLRDGGGALGAQVPIAVAAGRWTRVEVSLGALLTNPAAQIKAIRLLEKSGSGTPPTFYVDELTLAPEPPPVALALSVDAAANRRRISPDIYGIQGRVSEDRNQTPTLDRDQTPNQAMAQTLRLPVRRWGGNATSRYNYTIDATNVAADWFFENIGKTAPVPADPKESSAVNDFIRQDRSTGTRSLVTVPLLGWIAKDRSSCTFDATLKDSSGNPVYGPQKAYDTSSGKGHCGNGILANGTPIVTTEAQRLHAHRSIQPSFVEDWVRYLVSKFGQAKDGGVAFYNLDNEPMLWNDTHRDVFPDPLDYDGLYDRTYRYAAAIKAADPSAKTLGPVAWGWDEYFYSALDRVVTPQCQAEGKTKWWQCTQDRKAHGNLPLVAWYLDKLRQYEQQHGIRLLDYLDLHYYPEASGVARQPAGSLALQAQRLRSTRSLWDPSYVDESWINEPIRLIPRMRQWVDQYYPGTKLAITEYNFGALEHINGALAQADVLGIFGREGVDLATLWWYRDPNQLDFNLSHPAAFAFRMYRNYDGAGHGFGDVSTKAESTDQGQLAVYAAHRTDDGALTIMVINKSGQALTVPLALSNFSPAPSAKVFRYSGDALGAIASRPDQPVTSSGFTAAYPPNSITLFVLASGAPAGAAAGR